MFVKCSKRFTLLELDPKTRFVEVLFLRPQYGKIVAVEMDFSQTGAPQ